MTPWGFLETSRGLVANTSVRERQERAELGETAILLCTQLGISAAQLVSLREVLRGPPTPEAGPPDLVAALEGLRGA